MAIRDVTIVNVLAHCGLRVSELIGLTMADIDRHGDHPLLRTHSGANGGKRRTVSPPSHRRPRTARVPVLQISITSIILEHVLIAITSRSTSTDEQAPTTARSRTGDVIVKAAAQLGNSVIADTTPTVPNVTTERRVTVSSKARRTAWA